MRNFFQILEKFRILTRSIKISQDGYFTAPPACLFPECVCTQRWVQMATENRSECRSPWMETAQRGCWDSNLGTLQEQQVLSPTEPCLQPRVYDYSSLEMLRAGKSSLRPSASKCGDCWQMILPCCISPAGWFPVSGWFPQIPFYCPCWISS